MSFLKLKLIEPLIKSINELGYIDPTAIQMQAIPVILQGQDLLGSAQTGTGKTASFVLPILQRLSQEKKAANNHPKALILAPTRELAAQIFENILQYSKYLSIRSAVIFGGVNANTQIQQLNRGVDILVATPGRLLDLHQQQAVKFGAVDTFVLDEADRMLDMGFIHDIKKIIRLLPSKRQNLMFSATFSDQIRGLAKNLLSKPIEINVASKNSSAETIKQTVYTIEQNRKTALLSHLIHNNNWGQTLVFSRTKHGANKLVKKLADSKIHSVAIHGNKSQSQRIKALAEFKSGKVQILVATDIAARGIDIEKLPCVVNFDLPHVAEDYVHRIGRTGRAGASGLAVSLVCNEEIRQLHSIEKLIKQKLLPIEIPEFKSLESPVKAVSNGSTATKRRWNPSPKKQTR